MKSRLCIASATLVAVLEGLAALQGNSPLASIDDYIFTHPAQTNHIKGFIIGTNAAYATPRFEDIAYLREALAERDFLSRGNVSTNDFLNAVTNGTSSAYTNGTLYVDELRLENTEFGPDILDRFISPDVVLSDSPRLVTTNDVVFEVMRPMTNVFPAVTNFVYQTMTNGTLNVYTNIFGPFISNRFERVTVTNQVIPLDFITTNAMLTLRDAEPTFDVRTSLPTISRRSLSLANMTNYYAVLERMRLVVPRSVGVVATNAVEVNSGMSSFSFKEGPSWETPHDYEVTNKHAHLTYSVDAETVAQTYNHQRKQGDAWIEYDGESGFESSFESRSTNSRFCFEPFEVLLETGLCDLMVDYMTKDPRVSRAIMFGLFTGSYAKQETASHSVQGGIEFDVETNVTIRAKQVMVPLGELSRVQGKEYLTYKWDYDAKPFMNAASLLGLPLLEKGYIPTAPSSSSPAWDYDDPDDPHVRESSTYQYAHETLTVGCDPYIILTINPKTKLPNAQTP